MEFKVINRNGFPRYFIVDDLEFAWNSWVLCEIAHAESNPIHLCMASDFRLAGKNPTAMIWNLTYDDDGCSKYYINKLAHFRPFQIIHSGYYQNLGMPTGSHRWGRVMP